MSGGWLHTGDMAVWDEENYIHIVDRKKDIIISGGENISSIEVERAIGAHPAVLECAVVSAPDAQWGEVPAAYVVLKPGAELAERDLGGFPARPAGQIQDAAPIRIALEPLPKTGTGKILKRELRETLGEAKSAASKDDLSCGSKTTPRGRQPAEFRRWWRPCRFSFCW